MEFPPSWSQHSRGGVLSGDVFHFTVNASSLPALEALVNSVQIEREWGNVSLFRNGELFLEAHDFMDACTFVYGHSLDATIEGLRREGVIEASWYDSDTGRDWDSPSSVPK
ncbi:hypothetical protein HQ560_16245 [bacterium]|nr:hypothetical protein [bacterium]